MLGCSYNFSEDNYIDLEAPTIDGISIRLNSFNEGDTINVERRMSYTINKGPDQYGISTEILLDNKRIGSSSRTDSGEFTLRPSLYDDGEHTIRIVHVLSSGTGSIAEQQQLETLTAIKEFQFTINREPSTPPTIAAARIENGSITLEWQNDDNPEYISAYLSLQFPDYEKRIPLTAEMLERESYIDTYTVLFPLDSNRPEDEDRSRVTYSIVLISDFEEVSGQGATLEHDPSWLDVSMSFVDLESFRVSWPQHPLYANFDAYRISIRKDYFYEAHIVNASTLGGTELVNAPYSFGADYFGTLFPETNYDPYIPSYNYRPRLDENSFVPISNMQPYYGRDFIYNPSTQQYYLLALENYTSGGTRGVSIFRYNSDMEFLDRTRLVELSSSGSNTLFTMNMDPESNNFYVDIRYRNRDEQLVNITMELDKFSLNRLKEYVAPQGISGPGALELRGNILKTWDYQTKLLTLTNVDTHEVFYSLNAEGSNSSNISYLSNDGKYLFLRLVAENAVYRIANNTVTKRLDLVERPYGISSIEIYADKLYYSTINQNIEVIDLITNQTIATSSFVAGNNSTDITYDPLSNKILGTQYEVCFIHDLNSGETSQFSYESYKGYSQLGGDYNLWLTNGKLIHSKGIYVDIE